LVKTTAAAAKIGDFVDRPFVRYLHSHLLNSRSPNSLSLYTAKFLISII
jgi:hypothetical protein